MGLGALDERARGDRDGKSRLEGANSSWPPRMAELRCRCRRRLRSNCMRPRPTEISIRIFPITVQGTFGTKNVSGTVGGGGPRIETPRRRMAELTEKIRRLTKRSAEDARRGREREDACCWAQVEEPERQLCGEREGTAPPQVHHTMRAEEQGLS